MGPHFNDCGREMANVKGLASAWYTAGAQNEKWFTLGFSRHITLSQPLQTNRNRTISQMSSDRRRHPRANCIYQTRAREKQGSGEIGGSHGYSLGESED